MIEIRNGVSRWSVALGCFAALVIVCGQQVPATAQFPYSNVPRYQSTSPEQPTSQGMQPHPSVVRVIAQGPASESRGSGTLIGVDEQHGYVLTNCHVVESATGTVVVQFPDGFESAATIIKQDALWDLALLAIWRPDAIPMPLSPTEPQPSESLIIAGYGQGSFRAARGVFADNAAPNSQSPFDMFEVSVPARQGDSGGPIVNERGELAGVLFGTGQGRTTGTKIGRVRRFLDEAFQPHTGGMSGSYVTASREAGKSEAAYRVEQTTDDRPVTFPAEERFVRRRPAGDSVAEALANVPMATEADYGYDTGYQQRGSTGFTDALGSTPLGTVEMFLGVVGIFAVVLHLLPR